MNPNLERLQAYPFERLAQLKQGVTPPKSLEHIGMSIGEPQHAPPEFILEILRANAGRIAGYPPTLGMLELRAAAARWLERRFSLGANAVDPEKMVLPVNGTREALFSFVQAAVDSSRAPLVAMPNPCYQIYEGAAYLAGAEPYFLNTTPETHYVPDLESVPAAVWNRCEILFLCSPGNPTGAIASLAYFERALELAERHAFLIASDECYSELYLDERSPPPGLLQACLALGRKRFERCVVFHSLSKRSSVPGLRSGFVAGDPTVIEKFLLYRTYHGSAVPAPTQLASIAAWNEDTHASVNRALYQEKFAQSLAILSPVMDVYRPDGAFYLWPKVPGDDAVFTRELFARQNITVVPGTYLARETERGNPGRGRVRISLTPHVEKCVEAAERIREFMRKLG
jgi:N-succinyldiaminopimelate aminotransferase